MSAADTTLLTRQREMLMQKLDEFERTNKSLRRLLREHQTTEVLSLLTGGLGTSGGDIILHQSERTLHSLVILHCPYSSSAYQGSRNIFSFTKLGFNGIRH